MMIAALTCLKLWSFVQSKIHKKFSLIKQLSKAYSIKFKLFIFLTIRKILITISHLLINFKRTNLLQKTCCLLHQKEFQFLIEYPKIQFSDKKAKSDYNFESFLRSWKKAVYYVKITHGWDKLPVKAEIFLMNKRLKLLVEIGLPLSVTLLYLIKFVKESLF